jgi:hypothetical protein
MLLVAAPFAMDAFYGLWILKTIFAKEEDSGLLTQNQIDEKDFNNRVPKVLVQTKISQKIFTKGWKFNLFNENSKVFK